MRRTRLLLLLLLSASVPGWAATLVTTTSLTASATTGTQLTPITLTASVNDINGPVPLGLVQFVDNGNVVATVVMVRTASAGFTVGTAFLKRGFAPGTHVITANYLGTNIDAASSSGSQTLNVTLSGQWASQSAMTATGSSNPYTFTDVVGGYGSVPTGTVTLQGGTPSTALGSASLAPLGTATYSVTNSNALSNAFAVDLGDPRNDGYPDILVGNNSVKGGVFGFLTNTPTNPGLISGYLSVGGYGYASGSAQPVFGRVVDLNGDGIPDVLIGLTSCFQAPSTTGCLLGDGGIYASLGQSAGAGLGNTSGSFAAATTVSEMIPLGGLMQDVNNDGILDLVFTAYNGTSTPVTEVALGNADGSFQTPYSATAPVAAGQPTFPGTLVGDLNVDGLADTASAVLVQYGTYTAQAVFNSVTVPGQALETVTASYGGDPAHLSSQSQVQVTNPMLQPTLVVTPSSTSGSIVYGTAESFTVSVSTPSGGGTTPTGAVSYTVNGSGSTAIALTNGGTGTASVSLGILPAGSYTVTVTDAGDTYYSAVSAQFTVQVTPVTVTATVNPVQVQQGAAIPTLTGSLSGVLNADVGSVTATFTTPATSSSPAGTYPAMVTLSGAASGNYVLAQSTLPGAVTIVSKPLATVSVTPSSTSGSIVYGTAESFVVSVATPAGASAAPTGAVSYSVNGGAATAIPLTNGGTGTGSVSLGVLPAGSYTVTVSEAGDSNYSATTTHFSVTVTQATVTATVNAVQVQQGAAIPALTGSLSGVLSADVGNVTATFTTTATSSSPVGSYPAMVTLSGSASGNYVLAQSTLPNAVTIVAVPSIAVSASPTSLTIPQGSTGSTVLTFTPSGGYTGTVNLSCTGLPANASCAFSPATVSFTASTVTAGSTLVVSTSTTTVAERSGESPFGRPLHKPVMWAAVLGLGLLALPRKKRRWPVLLPMLILLLPTMAALSGCSSGGSSGSTGTTTVDAAKGTYAVTVAISAGTSVSNVGLTVVIQ